MGVVTIVILGKSKSPNSILLRMNNEIIFFSSLDGTVKSFLKLFKAS